MALPNPDEKGNTGAGTGPLNFAPTPPTGPAPATPQYDEEGYPLPDATGIASGNAYDPSLALPMNPTDNPYPKPALDPFNPQKSLSSPYWKWMAEQKKLTDNQAAKKAWQEQHKDQKKAPTPAAAGTSAPATPFASAGVDLTKEGKGESFTDSIIKNFSEKGIPGVSNESKTTLDDFRASQPQDMSPYYDYASKLTSAKIDNAMSSRGSYGSSNATGQIGAAEMALRAQQAKDTAQYGLDRYAAEGNLAGSADATDARANALKYEWTKGLSDMAFKSQDAGEKRNQDLFNNNFSVATAKAGNYTDSTDKAITGVGEATDAANNVAMGGAADSVSNANADANDAASHASSVLDSANKFATNYYNYNSGEDAKTTKPKTN